MPKRLCIEAGCPDWAKNGLRCRKHSAEAERKRPSHRAAYRDPSYKRSRRALLDGRIPCQACGTFEDLTVDHIIPLSKGGTNCPGNLTVLCRKCNARKGGEERRGRP